MKKFLLFLFLSTGLCSYAQYSNPHSRYTRNIVPNANSPYKEIQFMQFLPPDYNTSSSPKHPLIIFLHGQGEIQKYKGETGNLTELNKYALPFYLTNPATTMKFDMPNGTSRSFVVLVPQKHDSLASNGYQAQFEAYYVDAMIKYARDANLNVDFSRVYLTGISLGAGTVYDYPSFSDTNAQKIAAIVPVSGSPVYGYQKRNGVADICNIAENKVASRAYVGSDDLGYGGGQLLFSRPDSAKRARDHINDTCVAPGKITSVLSLSPGGHNDAYWSKVYNPTYGDGTDPSLNMYRWMLGFVSAAQVGLPVNLLYFKGKNLSEQNILDWSTTREMNFDRFEILRSSDGKTFISIATIKSQEGNQSTKNYSFKDKAPNGMSHYQLKQIDKDNSYKLSPVITVNNKNQAFIIEKYPNPVISQLNISIEGNLFGAIELQVLDTRGILVKKMTIRKDQATWTGFVDVKSLANGMYMLQMKSADGRKEVSNFIKK